MIETNSSSAARHLIEQHISKFPTEIFDNAAVKPVNYVAEDEDEVEERMLVIAEENSSNTEESPLIHAIESSPNDSPVSPSLQRRLEQDKNEAELTHRQKEQLEKSKEDKIDDKIKEKQGESSEKEQQQYDKQQAENQLADCKLKIKIGKINSGKPIVLDVSSSALCAEKDGGQSECSELSSFRRSTRKRIKTARRIAQQIQEEEEKHGEAEKEEKKEKDNSRRETRKRAGGDYRSGDRNDAKRRMMQDVESTAEEEERLLTMFQLQQQQAVINAREAVLITRALIGRPCLLQIALDETRQSAADVSDVFEGALRYQSVLHLAGQLSSANQNAANQNGANQQKQPMAEPEMPPCTLPYRSRIPEALLRLIANDDQEMETELNFKEVKKENEENNTTKTITSSLLFVPARETNQTRTQSNQSNDAFPAVQTAQTISHQSKASTSLFRIEVIPDQTWSEKRHKAEQSELDQLQCACASMCACRARLTRFQGTLANLFHDVQRAMAITNRHQQQQHHQQQQQQELPPPSNTTADVYEFDGTDELIPQNDATHKVEVKEKLEKGGEAEAEEAASYKSTAELLWEMGALSGEDGAMPLLFSMWWMVQHEFGINNRLNHALLKWGHFQLSSTSSSCSASSPSPPFLSCSEQTQNHTQNEEEIQSWKDTIQEKKEMEEKKEKEVEEGGTLTLLYVGPPLLKRQSSTNSPDCSSVSSSLPTTRISSRSSRTKQAVDFVRLFQMYAARRPTSSCSENAPFYLQPLRHTRHDVIASPTPPPSASSGMGGDREVWFSESGLGKNKIGALFRNVVEKWVRPRLVRNFVECALRNHTQLGDDATHPANKIQNHDDDDDDDDDASSEWIALPRVIRAFLHRVLPIAQRSDSQEKQPQNPPPTLSNEIAAAALTQKSHSEIEHLVTVCKVRNPSVRLLYFECDKASPMAFPDCR